MSLPELHVEGTHLVDSTGKKVRLPGYNAFAAFARFCMTNGWDALVLPNLQEYRAIATEAGYHPTAPLALRVFRYAAPPNRFALDPWSYTPQQVTDFTRRCGELGFYVIWSAGDAAQCFPSGDGQRGQVDGDHGINQHQNVFCAALVPCSNAIWNTSNEPFKNGVDVGQVVPPPWAPKVQFSGNYEDSRDKRTDLNCINLHTDRSEENGAQKWVGKGFESAPYLWVLNKVIIYDEGMGADDVGQGGRRSNVPDYFFIQGQELSAVSINLFHSTDDINGDTFGPRTRLCALAFMRGAVGALTIG